MKSGYKDIPSKVGRGVFLITLLTMLSLSSAFAGGDVFKEGKKYKLVSATMGGDGTVIILEEPDENSWVKVKVLTKGMRKYIGNEGYVNLSNYIMAKEVK